MTHYAFGLPGCRRSGSNGWLFVTFGARSRWRLYAFAENIKGVRLCICALVSTLGANGLEGTITAAYGYTADGLRSRWDPVNAFTWHYLYDPSGNLAVRQWITQSGTTANYGADDVSIYEGYGALRQCAAPKSLGWSAIAAFDSIGFGGQWGDQTDIDTGLVFCTHRYYDPSTGRWLTRDPIGTAGGVNEYAYCGGNPVNGVDPEGTDPEGHHLFPQSLRERLPLPPSVKEIFKDYKTGAIPDISHNYKDHGKYNKAVEALYSEFLASKGITSQQMNPTLAREFLGEIRNSTNEDILKVTRDLVAKQYVGAAINAFISGKAQLAGELMNKARSVVSNAVVRELLEGWIGVLGKGAIKVIANDLLGDTPLAEFDLMPPAMYNRPLLRTVPLD